MSGDRRAPRAGDVVEVRGREEILATLNRDGALGGLPFMPEMLAYCGRSFRVAKRADKTCDTVQDSGLRRMVHTVHLEGTRCDGSGHDGCEAACQIFWKEDWLRHPGTGPARAAGGAVGCCDADLSTGTRRPAPDGGEPLYRCQATDLREASTPLSTWSPSQYVRDIRSGNAGLRDIVRSALWNAARWARSHLRGYRIQVWLFNHVQRMRGGSPLMQVGTERKRTPSATLGLTPGDLVEVKSLDEIVATLDPDQRNRGLYFDQEMTPFCGGRFAVRSRVNRIINEKTGRMITIPGDCVILEDVFCTGRYHACCPRAIFPYWREIWLRRVPDSAAGAAASP